MLKFNEFLEANSNKLKDDTVLLIVCNAKSKTVASQNYNDFSIDTEFLSDDELNEITGMAQAQGIPFRIFYDEKDFMENLLLNDSKYFDRFIVYNSAQNGVGPGRKALIPSICKYFNIIYLQTLDIPVPTLTGYVYAEINLQYIACCPPKTSKCLNQYYTITIKPY